MLSHSNLISVPYLFLFYPSITELKQALQALDAQVHCILGPGPATLYRDIAAYLLDAPALRAELEGYADALTPTADCQLNPGINRCLHFPIEFDQDNTLHSLYNYHYSFLYAYLSMYAYSLALSKHPIITTNDVYPTYDVIFPTSH